MKPYPVIYSVLSPARERRWFLGWMHDNGIHRHGGEAWWNDSEMALLFTLKERKLPPLEER